MAVTKNCEGQEEVHGFKACLTCTQNCFNTHRKGSNSLATSSYFFKVLVGDFAKFLRIPPEFVAQMQHQVDQNAFLEGPSGQIWRVTICFTGTEMTFEDGWQTFVSDHSLDFGDFLVFKSVGQSYFIVQVFGRSGCERRDAFTVRNSERCSMNGVRQKQQKSKTFIKSKDSDSSEEDDQGKDSGFSLRKPIVFNSEGESISESLRTDQFRKSRDEACTSQYHFGNQGRRLCDAAAVQPMKKAKITPKKLQAAKRGGKQYVSTHFVSCRRHVTQQERKKALEAAESFQSDKPFTIITMKQSQVYQGFWLSLSIDFSKRYLPDQRRQITLLSREGKKWPIQYLGDRSNPGLSGGWKGFAVDNNLEEGDVCVFELENEKNYTLKVHIYRVVENCTPPKKVLGVKPEDSGKRSATVKKCARINIDAEDTKCVRMSPKPTPNMVNITGTPQVKANSGFPTVTDDVIIIVPKTET